MAEPTYAHSTGLSWSERFVRQFEEKEFRDAFVEEQVRTRIALLIRVLREQPERGWSQTELGRRMGKAQSVVSRIEDPDYGKLTLQTLFEVAAAFDLPLFVDFPEWEDWFTQTSDVSTPALCRQPFNLARLITRARRAGGTSPLAVAPTESRTSADPSTRPKGASLLGLPTTQRVSRGAAEVTDPSQQPSQKAHNVELTGNETGRASLRRGAI